MDYGMAAPRQVAESEDNLAGRIFEAFEALHAMGSGSAPMSETRFVPADIVADFALRIVISLSQHAPEDVDVLQIAMLGMPS